MCKILKYHLFVLSVFVSAFSFAQEGVRKETVKKEISGKILIVPFESKMYMSDIDQKVNQLTKWNAAQITEYFRHQLDSQLKLKLQSILSPVVSFYTDSVKTAKDLDHIYKSTSIVFDMIDKPSAPTAIAEKKDPNIKNGQLAVQVSNDKKFSNVKFLTDDVITYLNKKYQSDYFVFINELDIRTAADSYDLSSDTYQREVTVHYTVVDKTSKLIMAGAATSRFSSKINEPKKIVSLAFSPIASYIAAKFTAAIKPKEVK